MSPQRARILIAVLVVASLTMVILDLRGGQGPFSSVKSLGSGAVAAAESVGSTLSAPFLGIRDWWGTWGDQRATIAELQSENDRLASLVRRSENDRNRAEQLDGLLRVAGVGQYTVIPAEVIAIGSTQQFAWTVSIDAGADDGIERDMSVINADGLVGRVQSVRANSATVVLLVDKTVSIGARVAGSGEVGILSGTGQQDQMEFELLDARAPLKRGDALVTFGSKGGRPYAPGIPIGEIVSVSGTAGQLTQVAIVRPFADISRLGIVGVVVRPPRTDPRDVVLPARPQGSQAVPIRTPEPQPSGASDGIDTPASPAPSES